MDGAMLVPGARDLFRSRGKQVPVIFVGKPCAFVLVFREIATGRKFTRKGARALSLHYDDCSFLTREEKHCRCKERLAAEAENAQ